MTRTHFNDGWTVGPNVSVFAEITGGATTVKSVTLPHDAMLSMPRSADAVSGPSTGYFEGGAVIYRKSFTAPVEWRNRVVELEFHGVYRDAMVYLNGVLIGQRPNGYSAFRVRLDEALRYGGENRLRVDARAHHDSRWYSGLGIYRDVDLLDMPLTHLEPNGVRLTTPDIDDERAVVEARTTVVGDGRHPDTVHIRTRILDQTGGEVAADISPITVRPGKSATAVQRLYVNAPVLWSPDSPALYRVETDVLAGDDVTDAAVNPLGVRRLQLDPTHGLRINGEVVKLRGSCVHHDNGVLGAVSVPDAEYRRVRILKEAGFNAIRSAHNPIGPALLDACDRLGMLVMDESFDMWTEGKQPFDYSLSFPEWWERDLEAMVARDFNHPSVIMYSIGNEILDAGKPLGAAVGRRLADKVRSLDPSRYLTNGINAFVATLTDTIPMIQEDLEGVVGGINDVEGIGKAVVDRVGRSQLVTDAVAESFAVVDVVGHNYEDWRYEKDRDLHPNRIVLGSETNPADIDVNWELVSRLPHVIGDFVWTGWDYLGEAGLGRTTYSTTGGGWTGGDFPALLAYCGDIDITGFRRPASFYRQIVFGLRAEPYIAVHRPVPTGASASGLGWAWTDSTSSWTWDVEPGVNMTVDLYSDADEVELRLNGSAIATAPAGVANRYQARFYVPYEAGTLEAVAIRGGVAAESYCLETAGEAAAIWAEVDAGHEDAPGEFRFLNIGIVDDQGRIATLEERRVTVTVDGDGELAGFGSGRPATQETFLASSTTTFEGRAFAVVRTGGGDATLTITSEGVRPVVVELPSAARSHADGGDV